MGCCDFVRCDDGPRHDVIVQIWAAARIEPAAAAQSVPMKRSSCLDIPLDFMGAEDDLTFFALADAPVEGQGVALFNAGVVDP